MSLVWFVTGGHPFERDPLIETVHTAGDAVCASIEYLEQPEALKRIQPGSVDADAIVFYDMPGLRFTRQPDAPVEFVDPPAGYIDGLVELLGSGVGMIFMHHAIASWPTSPEFADLLGGRFHYQPGTLRGTDYPDSGYLFNVTHTVEVLDVHHPIAAGLPMAFELTDELYQFPVTEGDVTPLMRTRHTTSEGFFSADLAVRGRLNDAAGWCHPPGSALVAWTREPVPDGRLAYLQFGDGPVTYTDPTFRRILMNAIGWAADIDR